MLTLVRMRFRASIRAALDMASNLREERYLHGVKRRKITTRHCPHCHQTLAYKTFKAHKRRYFNRDTSEWYCEHAELSDTGDTDTVAESGHLRFCLSRLQKVTFRLFPHTVTGLFAFLHMLEIAKCFDG